jgi:hypothetical protein
MSRPITTAFLLLALGVATPALADTLTVTGGHFGFQQGFDGLAGTITGDNFSYSACCNQMGRLPMGSPAGIFSNPGATLTFGGLADFGGPNGFTLNGVSYTATAKYNFISPSFTLTPPNTNEFFTVSQPFTMAGAITYGYPGPLSSADVVGQGVATGTFRQAQGFEFIVGTNLVYSFIDPTVIPEPTSVLLVASGLAGLGLWRRRVQASDK